MSTTQSFAPLAVIAVILACAPAITRAADPDNPSAARAGEAIDDSVITTKVKAAYVQDPLVGALDIHVETVQGTVRLSGFVRSEAERERAATLAQAVEGVKDVKNGIQVTK
ncbi:BON domain-containing protein [Methylomagnum sp.]